MKIHRAVVAAALLASGCARHAVRKETGPVPPAGGQTSYAASKDRAIEASEPVVRDELMRNLPELKTVNFGYDSDYLGEEARAVLSANADWLKDHAGVRVQVAGYCDQRGTISYNLALGQRRAAAAREYYESLGVSGDRIATISYGKERALCAEAAEPCWSRNRRAETLEALSQNVSSAASPRVNP